MSEALGNAAAAAFFGVSFFIGDANDYYRELQRTLLDRSQKNSHAAALARQSDEALAHGDLSKAYDRALAGAGQPAEAVRFFSHNWNRII